ncbi:Na(+)/H(+) exchange regulatory cofactor NHE-RF1 [Myotis brandtii]|uniref:Na(+)/H(+) exchange regulatory cofactor NHE-RF1 n=1 Tax=Myotis brandtii TaxID=109478 RepID=S7QCW5_MYOBR|nr:Na(+)/H(+) exchange regulatory cofactor NHE-RF1 [Myotis brandtii]
MKRGPNGYGFNLHSDKTKPGQFIRSVDPDSPAEASGLRAQDRIVEVNGVCMEGKQHGDVVSAIKAGGEETKLLVVDKETDEFFKKCKVIPSHEHLHELRPVLVTMPRPQVNGVCMEGKQHGDVVSAIKAGGEETKLLVVDKETDEFFKKCKVIPSHEHLHGPLPEPFTNGEIQKDFPNPLPANPYLSSLCQENSYEALSEVASENPRPALARSASSDTSEELNSQDSPKKQDSAAPSSTSSSDPIPDFNISLAVAKERAHQKRSNKRAPQMDWSKKNELFSNL